jgi:hypothetical protein
VKVTLLGTGSPLPSLKRASSSYLVEAGKDVVLIDHGPGAFQRLMEAGKRATDVTCVFLSHLHFDHCADVIRLFHHRWDASGDTTPPLRIYGPPGTQEFIDRVFGPQGAFSRDLAMPVWQAAMNAAAPSFGGDPIEMPRDVVEVPVCTVSGGRATEFCQTYVEDPATGIVKSRSTSMREYFRVGTERFSFCSLHGGMSPELPPMAGSLPNLPALDAVPVRPKSPVLIGDDPYHSEVASLAAAETARPFVIRRRTNVLDSLDLGDVEESLPLPPPRRMVIEEE